MTRTVKIILILLLVSGLMACKGGNKAADQSGSTASAIEFPGGWKPHFEYKNNVNITVANLQPVEGYDFADGDDFARWWAKAFNVKLEVTTFSFDTWAELLRIWVSSGDMPDVCVFDYKHPDAAAWVDQGLIKRLPDNWKERWPNVARVYGKTTLGPQMENVFKGTYFLPRTRFDNNLPHSPLPDHCSFFFRKDWATAVGFPVKDVYKTSEIIEYGQLIKEKDPGKLGTRLLPISSRPNWAMRLFVLGNFAHYSTFYKDKDGVYKWGPAAPETLFGLKLWYKAYSTGALNPEFYTLRDPEDYDQFRVAGVSGGYFGEATSTHIMWNRRSSFGPNVGLDPDECVGVATVVGEDGYYHLEDLINYWGVQIFSPNLSDEKFERWMEMIDFGATDGGYILQNLGFQDIDWKYGPDGEYVSLLPEDLPVGGPTGKYKSASYTIGLIKLGDDLSFDNPTIQKVDREDSRRLYADRSRLSTPDSLTEVDWDLFCYDSPSMRKATLDYQLEFSNMITNARSEADLENIWERWIVTQRPIVQPVLDELNNR